MMKLLYSLRYILQAFRHFSCKVKEESSYLFYRSTHSRQHVVPYRGHKFISLFWSWYYYLHSWHWRWFIWFRGRVVWFFRITAVLARHFHSCSTEISFKKRETKSIFCSFNFLTKHLRRQATGRAAPKNAQGSHRDKFIGKHHRNNDYL
jgi:hypothetical protein